MKKQEKLWLPDKKKMYDSSGNRITQSLFLETTYSEFAIYTLKEADHDYKGRVYPSIKRLYLEMEDPLEYEFAERYFLSWDHWNRIVANKLLTPHVAAWRNELELKIRSKAYALMQKKAASGSPMAIKWLADKGWEFKQAGRPTRAEIDGMKKNIADQETQYENDYSRLMAVK